MHHHRERHQGAPTAVLYVSCLEPLAWALWFELHSLCPADTAIGAMSSTSHARMECCQQGLPQRMQLQWTLRR